MSLALAAGLVLLGLLVLAGGGALLVRGATALARHAGVTPAVIGLTVVAMGTSLPELVVSATAALGGQPAIAMGNVIGSNIYNVLGILGVTAIIHPIPVPVEIASFDIWVMLASTLLLAAFAISGWRIARWEGGVLLAIYALYIAHLARAAAA